MLILVGGVLIHVMACMLRVWHMQVVGSSVYTEKQDPWITTNGGTGQRNGPSFGGTTCLRSRGAEAPLGGEQ